MVVQFLFIKLARIQQILQVQNQNQKPKGKIPIRIRKTWTRLTKNDEKNQKNKSVFAKPKVLNEKISGFAMTASTKLVVDFKGKVDELVNEKVTIRKVMKSTWIGQTF